MKRASLKVIDLPSDCLHFVNLNTLYNIDLKPSNDQSLFLRKKQKTSYQIKSDDSKLITGHSLNQQSDNFSANYSSPINCKKTSDNPQEYCDIFQGLLNLLTFHIDQNEKKIKVPSLIQSNKNADTSTELRTSFIPDINEYNIRLLKELQESRSNNTKTNTSRRKVKDINWPKQLHPRDDISRSQKWFSQIM